MSFSMELKTELANVRLPKCCNKAMLAGILQIAGHIHLSHDGLMIEFQSKNETVAKRVEFLIKNIFKVEATVLAKKQTKLNKMDIYLVQIFDKDRIILNELHLLDESKIDLSKECCKKAYVKGAFLATGSINNPETSSYHMEIQTFDIDSANFLCECLNEFELKAKVTKNKRGYIIFSSM